jgi:hypothetical protein
MAVLLIRTGKSFYRLPTSLFVSVFTKMLLPQEKMGNGKKSSVVVFSGRN